MSLRLLLFATSYLHVEGVRIVTDDNATIADQGVDQARLSASTKPLPANFKPGDTFTIYMYRAQSSAEYALNEGMNLANAEGVLWYLHNEVIQHCPRHYDITRIKRFRVTIRTSRELAGLRRNFGTFLQFDKAKCTNGYCEEVFERYGYVPGCIVGSPRVAAYEPATWYSLPGQCPFKTFDQKDPECRKAEPGGQCDEPDGGKSCTYHIEAAGELSLQELTGIKMRDTWCKSHSELNHIFWWGKLNGFMCRKRVRTMQTMFRRKYKKEPLDYESPECDGF